MIQITAIKEKNPVTILLAGLKVRKKLISALKYIYKNP